MFEKFFGKKNESETINNSNEEMNINTSEELIRLMEQNEAVENIIIDFLSRRKDLKEQSELADQRYAGDEDLVIGFAETAAKELETIGVIIDHELIYSLYN